MDSGKNVADDDKSDEIDVKDIKIDNNNNGPKTLIPLTFFNGTYHLDRIKKKRLKENIMIQICVDFLSNVKRY